MSRTVRVSLGLAVVYVLTLASVKPADIATGLGLGAVLALALRGRLEPPRSHGGPRFARRLAGFVPFAAVVLGDVAAGTWDVALRVLGLRPIDRGGIVRLPIGDRSDRGVAVSALATTLSPGSYLVDIDSERRELLLHVIDASDPDAVRARHERFYDRYQRRVFP